MKEETSALLVNLWFRALAWILLILAPALYLLEVFAFSFVKLLDYTGTSWGQVFFLPLETIAEIWSYARYGR